MGQSILRHGGNLLAMLTRGGALSCLLSFPPLSSPPPSKGGEGWEGGGEEGSGLPGGGVWKGMRVGKGRRVQTTLLLPPLSLPFGASSSHPGHLESKTRAHPAPKGNPVKILEPEAWAECGPGLLCWSLCQGPPLRGGAVDKGGDGGAWSKRRIHLGATPRGDLWYVSREPGKRFLFLLTSLAFLAFHSFHLSPLPPLWGGGGERGDLGGRWMGTVAICKGTLGDFVVIPLCLLGFSPTFLIPLFQGVSSNTLSERNRLFLKRHSCWRGREEEGSKGQVERNQIKKLTGGRREKGRRRERVEGGVFPPLLPFLSPFPLHLFPLCGSTVTKGSTKWNHSVTGFEARQSTPASLGSPLLWKGFHGWPLKTMGSRGSLFWGGVERGERGEGGEKRRSLLFFLSSQIFSLPLYQPPSKNRGLECLSTSRSYP